MCVCNCASLSKKYAAKLGAALPRLARSVQRDVHERLGYVESAAGGSCSSFYIILFLLFYYYLYDMFEFCYIVLFLFIMYLLS